MILSTRTIEATGLPLESSQDGIECTILCYRQHHQLVVGVHVPGDAAPKTPIASKSSYNKSNSSSPEMDSLSSMSSDDESFRRELEENDAAFMKRLTENDAIFRTKLAESEKAFLNRW